MRTDTASRNNRYSVQNFVFAYDSATWDVTVRVTCNGSKPLQLIYYRRRSGFYPKRRRVVERVEVVCRQGFPFHRGLWKGRRVGVRNRRRVRCWWRAVFWAQNRARCISSFFGAKRGPWHARRRGRVPAAIGPAARVKDSGYPATHRRARAGWRARQRRRRNQSG